MLLQRIPKPQRRASRWKSTAHLNHVRQHACVNCGSMVNIQAAHVRMGSGAGVGQKPDDWRAVPLCGPNGSNAGCHAEQHSVGEHVFWKAFQLGKRNTVDDVIAELIRTSPKRAEIERIRKERNDAL